MVSVFAEDATPCEEVHRVLFLEEKKSKDPVSTKTEMKVASNYVLDLEQVLLEMSLDLVARINEAKMTTPNKFVRYSVGDTAADIRVSLTMGDLKKMKMEFLALNKLNPFKNPSTAKEGFLYFIKGKA